MNFEENTVYTIKLNSGEELIAKVLRQDASTVYVNEPASIAPGPKGMQLMPSMFTADPSVEARINTNSIAICAKTDEEVKMKYIEMTTGIQVPEKKIILG